MMFQHSKQLRGGKALMEYRDSTVLTTDMDEEEDDDDFDESKSFDSMNSSDSEDSEHVKTCK